MTDDPKRIFLVLKNPEWDKLKPERVHLFGRDYASTESTELLEEVLNYGLNRMRKSLVYEDEFPFSYWTYIPKGSFSDVWVTPDVLADKVLFELIKKWLEATVNQWAFENKLPVKIERDKDREYVLKFIITI